MAATLQELKAQSPRYQAMSDEDFADLLYTKKYAEKMPRDEFDVRVGKGGKAPAMGKGFLPEGFQRFTDRMMDPIGIKDEAMGATQFARKIISGGTFDEASQVYAEARDRDRAEQAVAHKDYGIVPDLVGGLGVGRLMGKEALRQGVPLATRIWNSAKTGAKFGGAAGFGHSEGGVGERVIGAGEGALAGAVVGPLASEVVAPLAGRAVSGLRAGARSAGQVIQDTLGDVIPTMRRSTDARFVRSLQRQGMTVDEAAAAYEEAQALGQYGSKTQIDRPFTPADLGPATQRQARAIATIPGRGSTMAEEVYGARQAGQFPRTNEALARGLKVTGKDYAKTLDKLLVEQKTAADPLYAKFREFKGPNGKPVTIGVGPVLEASAAQDAALPPSLKRMMVKARAEFIDDIVARDMPLDKGRILGRDMSTNLSAERFDNAKRALDQMIRGEVGQGRNYSASLLTQLHNDLVAVADRATMQPKMVTKVVETLNSKGKAVKQKFQYAERDKKTGKPIMESAYAKARDAYSSPAKLVDALKLGRTFANADSEVTAASYKALTTAEKKMFRIGMARQLRRELGGRQIGQDMIGHFRKPNTQEILSDIMSPAEYRRFMGIVEQEKGFAGANTTIRGGSPTAGKLADVEDLNAFMTMGRVIKERGFAGAAFEGVGKVIERTLRMREVDAHNLARMMFETDVSKNRANFARLKLIYGPAKVAQGMRIANHAGKALMASSTLEAGQWWAQTGQGDRRLQPLP